MRKKNRRVFIIALAALALLLLIMYMIRLYGQNQAPQPPLAEAVKNILEKPGDTVQGIPPDSTTQTIKPQKVFKRPRIVASVKNRESDSAIQADSPSVVDTIASHNRRCASDTTPPWVYTDPSGGLHHGKIAVKVFGTKPCAIEWKIREEQWNAYTGEAIAIDTTTTLWLRAADYCGNAMAPREERYEIAPADTIAYCSDGMEHIAVGTTDFCMDRYEWPNKKGIIPKAYVSLYQAMDSCATVGKRLCTSDEWTIACTGPYGWKYPYGSEFQLYACVTHDTTARPSGSMPECRGYFGVFDMSGNLAEWTSTKSSKNIQFYNVMGGFWESGPQSGCFDVRYSYYPKNRHNPVGFRCCGGASPRPRVAPNGADKP